MPGLYTIEPKLVVAIRAAADEFRFVGDRVCTVRGGGLNRAHEDDGAFRKHAGQGDMFAGKFIPVELGTFYEEDLVFIPTGNLHPPVFRQACVSEVNIKASTPGKSSSSSKRSRAKPRAWKHLPVDKRLCMYKEETCADFWFKLESDSRGLRKVEE